MTVTQFMPLSGVRGREFGFWWVEIAIQAAVAKAPLLGRSPQIPKHGRQLRAPLTYTLGSAQRCPEPPGVRNPLECDCQPKPPTSARALREREQGHALAKWGDTAQLPCPPSPSLAAGSCSCLLPPAPKDGAKASEKTGDPAVTDTWAPFLQETVPRGSAGPLYMAWLGMTFGGRLSHSLSLGNGTHSI